MIEPDHIIEHLPRPGPVCQKVNGDAKIRCGRVRVWQSSGRLAWYDGDLLPGEHVLNQLARSP